MFLLKRLDLHKFFFMKSVITCDMEGVIETINPDGEKLFGYSKEDLIGKKRVSLFSAG